MNLDDAIKKKIINKTKYLKLKEGEEKLIKIKISKKPSVARLKPPSAKTVRHYEDLDLRSRIATNSSISSPMLFCLSKQQVALHAPAQLDKLVHFIERCRADSPRSRLGTVVFPVLARAFISQFCLPDATGLTSARRLLERYEDYALSILSAYDDDDDPKGEEGGEGGVDGEISSSSTPAKQLLDTLRHASLRDLQTNQSLQFFINNKSRVLLEKSCINKLVNFLKTDEMNAIALLFNQHISLEVLNCGLGFERRRTKVSRRKVLSTWRQEELLKIRIASEQQVPLPHIFTHRLTGIEGITAASIDSNGVIACACHDNSVQVFNLPPPSEHHSKTRTENPSGSGNTDTVNPDLTAVEDPLVLRGHSGPITSCTFASDSRFLLTASVDSKVYLWDVTKRASVATYHGHTQPIWDLSVSSTCGRFLTASADTTAKLWDTEYTACLRAFVGHSSDVNCVGFVGDPSGQFEDKLLVSGGADASVMVWDPRSGQPVRRFPVGIAAVSKLATSPCGQFCVSVGDDYSVTVWHMQTGVVRLRLMGFYGRCTSLVVSEHLNYVIASNSYRVFIWRLNPGADGRFDQFRKQPVVRGYQMIVTHLRLDGHYLHCVGGEDVDAANTEIYPDHV